MKEKLSRVWESKQFRQAKTAFFLSNYFLFRFIDEKEFIEENSEESTWFSFIQKKFGDKRIICIADFTGDRDHEAYILIDANNLNIYLYRLPHPGMKTSEPILLSDSLSELFGQENFEQLFVDSDNDELWSWMERCAVEYDIPTDVPKGIIPSYDLRTYFQEVENTFLSDPKEFNSLKFREYFSKFTLDNDIPDDFVVFEVNMDNKLPSLLEELNRKQKEYSFKIVQFSISGFWGIFEENSLSEENKVKFKRLGLTN